MSNKILPLKIESCSERSLTQLSISRRKVLAIVAATALSTCGAVQAQGFDVSQVPLYLGGTIDPNLIYLHDDSGSMFWSFMPDVVYFSSGRRRTRWSGFNNVYYNPNAVYLPPRNHENVSLGNASFMDAWTNGYQLDAAGAHISDKVNLSENFRPTWSYEDSQYYEPENAQGRSAYYYTYNESNEGCNSAELNDACFDEVVVSSTSGPGLIDLNNDGEFTSADKDERQNFANWYSYYRTRDYAAKAGVSRAFANLGEGIRIGYGRINKATEDTVDGKKITTIERGVRAFSGSDRKAFFDWLFAINPTLSTPLRRALHAAGEYYENSSVIGPWSSTPGVMGGTHLSCRQSYTILMTDGYWSDEGELRATPIKNEDGVAGPTISGPDGASYTYEAKSPFADGFEETLADVAMYYWKRDLHGSLANRVPTSVLDPAFWQHMVTFSIGLGVIGTISPVEAFAAIDSGAKIDWGGGSQKIRDLNLIDDLLHASINGRGGFFSAQNPNEFSIALSETLAKIGERTASSAAVATNSNRLFSGSLIYQVTFESGGWTGEITAFPLNRSTGSPASTASWSASTLIPAAAARKIFTWRPDMSPPKGVEFFSENLSDTQNAALKGGTNLVDAADVVNWVRGDQSKEEANGGAFRDRRKRLGDIVNSDPVFVGVEDYGYGSAGVLDLSARQAYVERKSKKEFKNRKRMLYVGSNDGMLHGFNAETGVEEFAYIPHLIGFDNLFRLTQPSYSHRYLVDGPARVADAYMDGAWKTVLVGSTGAGGKGYFALDVENPEAMSASKIMWEFTDAELGAAIGQAAIVVGENGQWLAIFGNGYNSVSHKAQLFIVDLKTGALLKKIDTQVGGTGTGSASPNGLATPLAIDTDYNGAVDLVYAGDMHGNLWKFDLGSKDAGEWGIPFSANSKPAPLFVARYGSELQAITAKPQAARNPTGGVAVYFGTGQMFEIGDQGDMRVQSFYGLIDKCGLSKAGDCGKATTVDGHTAHIARSSLVQQSIIKEVNGTFGDLTWDARITSENKLGTKDLGFYMDLVSPVHGKQGERAVSTPLIWDDRIIFVTQIPDPDPCSYGGESWIMELAPLSGARTTFSVFDMNADGKFDDSDNLTGEGGGVVSGRKVPGGLAKTPATVSGDGATFKYTMGSGAVLGKTANRTSGELGRQSWRQLR